MSSDECSEAPVHNNGELVNVLCVQEAVVLSRYLV
jgi:hypothetical protein